MRPREALGFGLVAAAIAVVVVTAGPLRPADASRSLPAPDGHGRVALLVAGRFGPASVIALDAEGRTLAYGIGDESIDAFSMCPDGLRVAEITDRSDGLSIAVRDLRTMLIVRRQRFRSLSIGYLPHCASRDGSQLVAFYGSGPDLDRRARLVRLTPSGASIIWSGVAWYVSYWRNFTFVQDLASLGMSILAVDARSGATRKLGTVPAPSTYTLAANAMGTRLVGESYDEAYACCPRLNVVDLSVHPIALRRIPLPATALGVAEGNEVWFSGDRFVYLGSPGVIVYSATLRMLSRFQGWSAPLGTVAVGSTLFGLRPDGSLVTAGLPSGQERTVRQLPGRPETIVAVR